MEIASTDTDGNPRSHTSEKKTSIISRREIEPLLARARRLLDYYTEAVGCFAVVLDKDGLFINTPQFIQQIQLCNSCENLLRSLSETGKKKAEIKYPCGKLHRGAQIESQRIEGTYIYTCPAGSVFWTSPLYSTGRCAGALTAGIMPGDKSHEEIQAMARLLGVCTEEISGNGSDPDEFIHHTVWQEPEQKIAMVQHNASQHNGAEYPLEKERMLLAAFRRGDIETGSRILTDLMYYIQSAVPGNFEIVRFRAIELAVLLSRAALDPRLSAGDALLEVNHRYLKRIQESKTAEELIENLHLIAERMAGEIFSFKGIRHASVLRKAERYIWENYSRKISLEEISGAAGLSAPYFSTIFREEMGENLSGYLNRLRVEKSAALLAETGKTLSEIAASCGFDDQSWFSKIFKRYKGISPGKFRKTGEFRDNAEFRESGGNSN